MLFSLLYLTKTLGQSGHAYVLKKELCYHQNKPWPDRSQTADSPVSELTAVPGDKKTQGQSVAAIQATV